MAHSQPVLGRPNRLDAEFQEKVSFRLGEIELTAVRLPDEEWRGAGNQLSGRVVGRISLDTVRYVVLEPADTSPPLTAAVDLLTRRELQVAMLIAEGRCDKEIARTLGISGYTVREHVRRIFAKLGTSRRSALVSRLFA